MNWPESPLPTAHWDAIVDYADRVDGYRRAGSFEGCMAVAESVTDGYRRTGELPRDAGALALTVVVEVAGVAHSVFVEVRRYRLVGSPDGTGRAYLGDLLAALGRLSQKAA